MYSLTLIIFNMRGDTPRTPKMKRVPIRRGTLQNGNAKEKMSHCQVEVSTPLCAHNCGKACLQSLAFWVGVRCNAWHVAARSCAKQTTASPPQNRLPSMLVLSNWLVPTTGKSPHFLFLTQYKKKKDKTVRNQAHFVR